MSGLRFATVCASNMNRSMEGHFQLSTNGFNVASYGTGGHVNLPGPDRKPISFDFGTPYQTIFDSIKAIDIDHFQQLGVVDMLERNVKLKRAPQRWQDRNKLSPQRFDVVIAYEERVFDAIVEDMERIWGVGQSTVVIMLQTKDNHVAAKEGGEFTFSLAQLFTDSASKDSEWINDLDQIISTFEESNSKDLTYSVVCS